MDLVKCPECNVLTPVSDMRCFGCGLPMCILLNIVDTGSESQRKESYISMDDEEYAALREHDSQKQEPEKEEKEDDKNGNRTITNSTAEEKSDQEKLYERAKRRIRGARYTPIQITVEEMAKYTEIGIIRWFFRPEFSFYSVNQNRFRIVFFSYNINSAYILDGTISNNRMSISERLFVIKKERGINTRFVLRGAIEKCNKDYVLKKLMVQVVREEIVANILEYWDILKSAAQIDEDHYFRKRENDKQISGLAASLGLKRYSSIAEPVGKTLSRGGKLQK